MSEIDQSSICPPLIIRPVEKSPIDTITLEDSEDLFAEDKNEDDEPVEVIDENDICQFIENNDLPNTSLSSLEPDFFQDSQEVKKHEEPVEVIDEDEVSPSIEVVDLDMEKPKKIIKLSEEDYEWNNDRSSHFYNITLQKSLPLGIYDKRLTPFKSAFEKEVHRIALENSKRTRSVARKLNYISNENSTKQKSPVKKSPIKKSSETKENSPIKKSGEKKDKFPSKKSSETKEKSPSKKSSDKEPKIQKKTSAFDKEIVKVKFPSKELSEIKDKSPSKSDAAKEPKVQKKSSEQEPSEFDKEIQKLVKQKNKNIRGTKRVPKKPSRYGRYSIFE